MSVLSLQGKGKGKKKGKGKCFPDDNEEANFQGFKENTQVRHKLRTLDVFAGVGGKHPYIFQGASSRNTVRLSFSRSSHGQTQPVSDAGDFFYSVWDYV